MARQLAKGFADSRQRPPVRLGHRAVQAADHRADPHPGVASATLAALRAATRGNRPLRH